MKIRKHGVWFSTNGLTKTKLAELAQGVERLNYDVLWYPESLSYESLSLGSFLLGQTERLCVGSGIANIYARDALTAMSGHNTLNCLYNDRFILGLGVSHIPLVETQRGHNYGKPVATMRAYLEAMASAKYRHNAASPQYRPRRLGSQYAGTLAGSNRRRPALLRDAGTHGDGKGYSGR